MRHPPGTGSKTDPVATDAKGRVLSLNITLTDLKGCDITEISFKCQETADLVDNVVQNARKQAVNAFERMMGASQGNGWPTLKDQRYGMVTYSKLKGVPSGSTLICISANFNMRMQFAGIPALILLEYQ